MIRPGRQWIVSVSLGVVALVVTSCAGSSGPGSAQTPTPTASATVSPTPTPAEALGRLARHGVHASYTALYVLRTPKMHGTELVRRTATRYRVDVDVAGRPRSTLIRTSGGFIACAGRGSGATCGRTNTVQLNFADPFTSYIAELARSSDEYVVRPAGVFVTHGSPPVRSTCFAVSGGPKALAVFPGTYCLSARGIPTRMVFASRSLTLRQFHAGRPAKGTFTPPATPR